ncbi:MAG TPA: glycerol-3-phosphate 1-O-acyltransferase PlsY [Candidatus Limnocylindria bacterium]|nr:glycerol-3-phosphate 1-O-acyltransferase PlsY [Candidatus Limnocylindria bacterium]
MSVPQYLLVIVSAYLIGSFSTGITLSRLQGRDIRREGSRSSGATNVTRVLGLGYGLLTFLGDFLKAALAVLLGRLIGGMPGMLAAGLFAVIGHNWPVYYKFKGGKGVVCSIAVLLLTFPVPALIAGGAAILSIVLTRYVSVGSLIFVGLSALLILFTRGFLPYGLWALVLFALAAYQHRANISRLLRGQENKFEPGRKK